ncbi:MAG: glycosyltransferase XagB, partial [Baekduia sp.]|nr:glycosyltransferase XagB [Baekduia sp.]
PLRHPYRTLRRFGPIGTSALALTGLVAVVAPLAWLPILGLAALGALQALDVTGALLPEAVVRLAGAEVLAVSAALVLLGGAGALRRRSATTARAALLAPVGFTLAGLGAWLGVAGVVAALGRADGRHAGARW